MRVYYPEQRKTLTLTPLQEEFFAHARDKGYCPADADWHANRLADLNAVYSDTDFLHYMLWYDKNRAYVDAVGIDKADILLYDMMADTELNPKLKLQLIRTILARNQAGTSRKASVTTTSDNTTITFEESVVPAANPENK